MSPSTHRRKVSVRTVPKLMPFMVGAVALAFTAAVLVVYTTPADPNYSRPASLGYMTLVLCLPALALGAGAWLATEKILRKRATSGYIEPAEEH